jgi:hypothetical protein
MSWRGYLHRLDGSRTVSILRLRRMYRGYGDNNISDFDKSRPVLGDLKGYGREFSLQESNKNVLCFVFYIVFVFCFLYCFCVFVFLWAGVQLSVRVIGAQESVFLFEPSSKGGQPCAKGRRDICWANGLAGHFCKFDLLLESNVVDMPPRPP